MLLPGSSPTEPSNQADATKRQRERERKPNRKKERARDRKPNRKKERERERVSVFHTPSKAKE